MTKDDSTRPWWRRGTLFAGIGTALGLVVAALELPVALVDLRETLGVPAAASTTDGPTAGTTESPSPAADEALLAQADATPDPDASGASPVAGSGVPVDAGSGARDIGSFASVTGGGSFTVSTPPTVEKVSPPDAPGGTTPEGTDGGTGVGDDATEYPTPPRYTAQFHLRDDYARGSADAIFAFGDAGAQPLACDWDGDGVDEAVIRVGATFHFRDDRRAATVWPSLSTTYGRASDIPLCGDWDGDGKDTVGVYRPADRSFRLTYDNATEAVKQTFGSVGWTPLVGDWDGDGADTIGVKTDDNVYYLNNEIGPTADIEFRFGWAIDLPVVGDWNGDGIDTIGLHRFVDKAGGEVRPAQWFFVDTHEEAGVLGTTYGSPGHIAVTGDWNGDGRTGIGVFLAP